MQIDRSIKKKDREINKDEQIDRCLGIQLDKQIERDEEMNSQVDSSIDWQIYRLIGKQIDRQNKQIYR